jgi:hypothetical protein
LSFLGGLTDDEGCEDLIVTFGGGQNQLALIDQTPPS